MNWERRIPPFAEDALEVLREAVEESGDEDESLSKDDARSLLVADDRFTDADAEYALDVTARLIELIAVHENVVDVKWAVSDIELFASASSAPRRWPGCVG